VIPHTTSHSVLLDENDRKQLNALSDAMRDFQDKTASAEKERQQLMAA
jgi:hypothetical protein